MEDHNSGGRCAHCNCGKAEKKTAKDESVWIDTASLPEFPPLKGDQTFDVVVIGGGITGLTAALELVTAGKKVAVIEASKVGQGVTGYTTAHITSIIDTRFQDLLKRWGKTKAQLVATSSGAAVEKISQNVTTHAIACDFAHVPGYLYSERQEDRSLLEQEAVAAQQLGLAASFTEDVPLPFKTFGGVKFENQAQFHPLQYLHGLVAAITQAGGLIFEMTRVTDVQDGEPCIITTEHGKLQAAAVIMATHTPITKMLGMQSKVAAYHSYVVAVRPAPSEGVPGLFWDTDQPYHYWRTYTTSAGPLVIVGGEDHKTGKKSADPKECYERIKQYTCKRLAGQPMYQWSAQVFEPVDGLPYIGLAPRFEHVYLATGYAGNGITFGTVAGMMLPALILHGEHAWQALYKPTRISFSWGALKRQIEQAFDIMKNLLFERFRRAAKGDAVDVVPGEGKILSMDGAKIAIYKDAHGNVTKLSPICPHAGCIVQWNNAEKTWDCPCHGSRFTAEGAVINGPAIKALEVK
ncbi:MAG: FAD-dependent oxidoreductase [Candidatus Andersenbacteria bacterium]